ncbi:MAG: hypothetical protein V1861_03195 [Candidatus Micrarchaeota archaeon]
MVRNLETDRMETGGGREGSRRDAPSRVWEKLRDKFTVAAVILAAGCASVGAQHQSTVQTPTPARETTVALQGGRTSAGQIEIGRETILSEGQRSVRFTANVTGENLSFDWLVFQDIPASAGPLLLNPRDSETGQPRYVGVVMRDLTLTDGIRGDFVVRVFGNATAPSSASEWSPILESDGTARPENVLFQLQSNGLGPVLDSRFEQSCAGVCMTTQTPTLTVAEYGPTTPLVLVYQKRTSAAGPFPVNSSELRPRE